MGAELKNQLNNWQEQQLSKLWGEMRPGGDGAVPKIIYASRTHSQLSQVVSELKRSSYRYMKVCFLLGFASYFLKALTAIFMVKSIYRLAFLVPVTSCAFTQKFPRNKIMLSSSTCVMPRLLLGAVFITLTLMLKRKIQISKWMFWILKIWLSWERSILFALIS